MNYLKFVFNHIIYYTQNITKVLLSIITSILRSSPKRAMKIVICLQNHQSGHSSVDK